MNLNYTSSLCKAKASCCLRAPPKPASGKQRFNFPGRWRASEQRVDSVCVHLPVLTADRLPGLSSALWPPPDLSPRVQSTSQSLATLEGSSASEPTLHQVQPPVSGVSGPPQPPRAGLACPFPVLLCGSAVPVTTAVGTAELLGWCFCTILPRRRRPGRKGASPGAPTSRSRRQGFPGCGLTCTLLCSGSSRGPLPPGPPGMSSVLGCLAVSVSDPVPRAFCVCEPRVKQTENFVLAAALGGKHSPSYKRGTWLALSFHLLVLSSNHVTSFMRAKTAISSFSMFPGDP